MSRVMSQLSLESYFNKVQPKLTAREEWVLSAIEQLGEASTETVAEYYRVGVNVISGRITGLKKKGLIYPTKRSVNKLGNLTQFYSAQEQDRVYDNEF